MILDNIKKTINKYGMLKRNERVLVAVSGGIDSIALLHALIALRDELGIVLILCHLNHMLRGDEARKDEEFVLGLPYIIERTDVAIEAKVQKDPLQVVARRARYGFFKNAAKECRADRIALAHNSDDLAETVLMRLIRGCGLAGLKGIPPVRDRHIRPLIETSRAVIVQYISKNRIEYREDSSNRKPDYLRNRIRVGLLPFIESNYNPSAKDALCRAASLLSMDNEYIKIMVAKASEDVILLREEGRIILDRDAMLLLHQAIVFRLFVNIVMELADNKAELSLLNVVAMSGILGRTSPNKVINLPSGLRFSREYNTMILSKAPVGNRQPFEIILNLPGKTSISEIALELETEIVDSVQDGIQDNNCKKAFFDLESLVIPLIVRNFKPGDRFIPMGMRGRKKLKNLFIDKKVPRPSRSTIPILVSGNDIVWVMGVMQSEVGKVTEDTKRVLVVEIKSVI
jgi:tRNA(Ile)-lysidine synthase